MTIKYSLVLVSLAFALHLQALTFQDTTHKFGVIQEEDGEVSTVFTFTNTGTQPISIASVYPACGCSATRWEPENVRVGEKGRIYVTFDPTERPGTFDKDIFVYSNDATVKLSIQGTVVPSKQTIIKLYPYVFQALRSDKNTLDFGTLLHTQSTTQYMTFFNDSEESVTLSFLHLPSFMRTQEESYELLPSQERIIPINIVPLDEDIWSIVSEKLVVVENEKPSNAVLLRAIIEEDFSVLSPKERNRMPKAVLSAQKIAFGQVKQPKVVSETVTLKNEGKRKLYIRNVIVSDNALSVTCPKKKLSRNAKVKIKFTLQSEKTLGERDITVQIITNDPVNPVQNISVMSNVFK